MTLADEIAEAQLFFSDPPKNESNTCEWVILPLLWASGYPRREIESRIADSTGQFPDYTLLPRDTTSTYYLEAKAWNVSLEDIHAKQALNYANHNGKRFVVLTNGQLWRLYDNAIQGLLGDKLIAQASLRETAQISELMTTLSKSEVLSGSLKRIASEISERKRQESLEQEEARQREEKERCLRQRQQELQTLFNNFLPNQLQNAMSELVLRITLFLSEQQGLEDISSESVSQWFSETLAHPLQREKSETVLPLPTQAVRLIQPIAPGDRILNLKDLQAIPVDGKNSRPLLLYTPDGSQIPVRSWVGFAEQAVRWLLQQSNPVPIPFEYTHANRWFLNLTQVHRRAELRRKFKIIKVNEKTVYMDTDRSGKQFLQDIHALCLEMKIAPEGFRISIEGTP